MTVFPYTNIGMRHSASKKLTNKSAVPPGGSSIGLIIALTGRTSMVLNRLEPITLPTHKSASFLSAAMMDVTNSGKLVPIATTNIPMMTRDSPSVIAKGVPWSMVNIPLGPF